MSLQVLVSGASGAVGRAIIEVIESDDRFVLAGEATSQQFFEPDVQADVIVDFSHPDLLERVAHFAARRRIPLVTGTTALGEPLQHELREIAEHIAICQAANFSVGVNLLVRLARQSAQALGEDFDIEILEAHHRRKLDAPSGTALWLGETVARARGQELSDRAVHDRSQRRQARPAGEIGFQAIRGGDVAGEHTVYFLAEGERLELTHRSSDRRVFARGALLAASRIIDRPAGLLDFSELVLESD
ncbi:MULTISPECIES: 4-hydroxy-tetrahydrodipicolinate reductase [unclassified Wenzhouxiangella]|uniref:4-hydroxy-tetrahydrodipicolinate reductase n=1 Tax=unclassified Wenzhouxiangella TaxID=2613841 RepID=UPI000E32A6F0|nr:MULTISPECIES: 4-hydroxy-tetrahydrodipicolinate reductase [unclassified Wenzhouxiangella]RFF28994.1 4-hydroxy-tetrahydrodipicolinate reductase [Wenzhouxiangella sp. 15181]RFP68300.1 4-hydroxy-tetrahydrodipicolinate reductase [Wenzhouxiangella sp. 15190]